jgi:hypothetical protein
MTSIEQLNSTVSGKDPAVRRSTFDTSYSNPNNRVKLSNDELKQRNQQITGLLSNFSSPLKSRDINDLNVKIIKSTRIQKKELVLNNILP